MDSMKPVPAAPGALAINPSSPSDTPFNHVGMPPIVLVGTLLLQLCLALMCVIDLSVDEPTLPLWWSALCIAPACAFLVYASYLAARLLTPLQPHEYHLVHPSTRASSCMRGRLRRLHVLKSAGFSRAGAPSPP